MHTYTSTWCFNCGHAHGWALVEWSEAEHPEWECPECDCTEWEAEK